MILYIDTEFTKFKGELISLGIVDENGVEFYEVRKVPPYLCHPWVRENVLPILNKEPVDDNVFQDKLWEYIKRYDVLSYSVNVIADWPEDLAFFLQWLCKPDGIRLSFNPSCHVISSGHLYPKIPHNALSDAIALKEWHQESIK